MDSTPFGLDPFVGNRAEQQIHNSGGLGSDTEINNANENENYETQKIGDFPILPMSELVYDESILHRYSIIENSRIFNPNYLNEVQKELTENDRNLTVMWIVEKFVSTGLSDEAMFLTIKIFDYLLGVNKISRDFLLIRACSCIFLSAKIEDTEHETLCGLLSRLAHITESEIIEDELNIAKILNFQVLFVTPIMPLRLFIQKIYSIDPGADVNRIFILAKLVALCTLFDEKCSSLRSEDIAKSSLLLVLKYIGRHDLFAPFNEQQLQEHTIRQVLNSVSLVISNHDYMNYVQMYSNLYDELGNIVASNE